MGGCRSSGNLVVQETEIEREENVNEKERSAFY